jgi:hypothetical protein
MITAAIVYILISVLLIVASALIFLKALRYLKQDNGIKRTEVLSPNSESFGELKNREEIVAELERQFRSSPSADI